jgi:hypothetical protein
VAGAIIAGMVGVSGAGAAMIVDSGTYGTHYDLFTAETGGRTLIQEFTVSAPTKIQSIAFYGWAADAEFSLLHEIGSTIRQEDEIWRGSFSNMDEGWHDIGGPTFLAAGTYYLVMESNSVDPSEATWFRAYGPSRVGLGGFSVGLSQPNLYAPTTVFNTFTFGAMAMRIESLEVPAPGAVALAGLAGLTYRRRRR